MTSSAVARLVLIVALVALWAAGFAALLSVRQARWNLAPQEFDLVSAMPWIFWGSLACGTLSGTVPLLYARSESMVTLCVTGIAFLYSPAFLLGLFPAISSWDAYLNTNTTTRLLAGEGISATNLYAQQYPAPTMLLAHVTAVTGLEPVAAGVMIAITVQSALVLAFMGLAREFLDPRASGLAALAILSLTPAIAANEHFSQWLVGYLGIWTLILMLMASQRVSFLPPMGVNACALLLGGSIVVSHPFAPVIAVATVAAIAAWGWRRRSRGNALVRWFTLTLSIGLVAWIIYVATAYLNAGVTFLESVFLGTQDVADGWVPLPFDEVLRRASAPAFTLLLLRIGSYIAGGVLAIAGFWAIKKRRNEIGVVLLLAAAGGLSVLIGIASEAPWLQRALYIVPPLLVLAAGITTTTWLGDRRWLQVHRWVGIPAVALMLALGFFLWHPPTLLYSLHPQQVGFVVWPQERDGVAYLADQTAPGDMVGSDLQTLIVYSYFDPDFPAFERGISIGSDLQARVAEYPTIYEGRWLMRSHRQELMAYQVQDLDPRFWDVVDQLLLRSTERRYDNGFVTIYRR